MSDYAAPSGPPPPQVPEGWKAVWNQQYNEWFYVNLHTKESTWEKPTAPAPRPGDDLGPGGAPPSYQPGVNAPNVSDTKKTPLDSNNPYNQVTSPHGETDEEMARRLQREEEQRRGAAHSPNPATMTSDRGASDSYYGAQGQQQQQPYMQGGYPGGPQQGYQNTATSPEVSSGKRSSGGGLFGKLKDKLGSAGGAKPGGFGGMMGSHGGGGHYPQQGYPQQGYGGYPQQGYGGYPQQHYGGHGMMPGGMMHGGRKKPGMGAGGAAALGVGGGLLGGMMLANAMDGDDYQEGFADGADFGDGGGDFGGDF